MAALRSELATLGDRIPSAPQQGEEKREEPCQVTEDMVPHNQQQEDPSAQEQQAAAPTLGFQAALSPADNQVQVPGPEAQVAEDTQEPPAKQVRLAKATPKTAAQRTATSGQGCETSQFSAEELPFATCRIDFIAS